MELILNITTRRAKRAKANGRDFLVAPATMIVPGVLAGSKGPLYYPPEEVANNVESWDQQPLTANHPTDNSGQYVSAHSKGAWNKHGIGVVQNPRINKRGSLVGEAWFDLELTKNKAPILLDKLKRGEPIELSTGLFTDDHLASNGSVCPRSGKPYKYIARNYRPDHLAVLLDTTGACSLNDGCGIGVVNANPEGCNQYKKCGGGAKPMTQLKGKAKKVAKAIASKVVAKYRSLVDRYGKTGALLVTAAWVSPIVGAGPIATGLAEGVRFIHNKVKKKPTTNLWLAVLNTSLEDLVSEAYTFLQEAYREAGEQMPDELTEEEVSKAIEKAMEDEEMSINAKRKKRKASAQLDMSPDKACKIIKDGTVHGKPLTEKQRGMFGAKCGERANNQSSEVDMTTVNANPKGCNQHTGPGCGVGGSKSGSTGSTSSSTGPKSTYDKLFDEAKTASDKAWAATGTTRADKRKRAKLARAAAKAHDKAGRNAPKDMIKFHFDEAAMFENSATRLSAASYNLSGSTNNSGETMSKLSQQQRSEIVSNLTTNCDCWKGKGDDKVLNAFSDDKLLALKKHMDEEAEKAAVLNAAKKGFTVSGVTFTVNSSGEFIAKKGDVEVPVSNKESCDKMMEKEEEAEGEPTPAKKKGVKMNENQDDAAGGTVDPAVVANAVKSYLNGLTPQQKLKLLGSEMEMAVNNAIKVEKRERETIINKLVSNISDPTRKADLAKKLAGKSLDDLNDMVALLPTTNQGIEQPNDLASYFGAGGYDRVAPVVNEEDLLPLPGDPGYLSDE